MAEAIALAAGIIAVIQISDRIIGLTKHYIETIRDAPRDLIAIRTEISMLKAVFENLKLMQDCEYASANNLQALSEKDGAVEGCKRSVADLEKLLDTEPQSASGVKRRRIQVTLSSLAWQLKENKVKKLRNELSRYKMAITLFLSSEQAYVHLCSLYSSFFLIFYFGS
jgi:hypothetical protein